MALDPTEIATVDVNGQRFEDWETVFVQVTWGGEANAVFKFTAAERDPMPDNWTKLQFKPGDKVAIYLAGIKAIEGTITIRTTTTDAEDHTVTLFGRGQAWWAMTGTVDHPTNEFDGKTFEQVAREVFKPSGVPVKVVGKLDETKFERLQCSPGELCFNFVERIARVRGAGLGTNENGDVVLIGQHSDEVKGSLIEGVNILRSQGIISIEEIYSQYPVIGQIAYSPDKSSSDSNEVEGKANGTSPRPRPRKTPAEQPLKDKAEADMRAQNEAKWSESTIWMATIVTTGWLSSAGGGLWRVGEIVMVQSPMLMMNRPMGIQVVTYTQSREAGTLTTMELVLPYRLNAQVDLSGIDDGVSNTNPGEGPEKEPPPTPPPSDPAPATLDGSGSTEFN